VVAVVDGDFTAKQLYQRLGRIKLKAANPTFPDMTGDDQPAIVLKADEAAVKKMVDAWA
jgi:DNA polymerase V